VLRVKAEHRSTSGAVSRVILLYPRNHSRVSKSPLHRRASSPRYRSTVKFAQRARVKSVGFAQRATANTVDFAQRTTVSSVDLAQRATATTKDIARKHSRVSAVAAAAAAAGVLGAAGFTAGAAPWAQAIDNVSKTVQGGSQPSSGQLDSSLFAVITGTTTAAKPAAQLDSINSAGQPGSATSAAGTHNEPAKHVAVVAAAAVKQPSNVRQPAKAGPSKAPSAKAPAAKAQVVKAQVVKAQPAKAQVVKAKPAKPKAAAAPAKPYTIYDSVTPSSIPSGQPAAVYANGNYAASSSQMAGHKSVLWIDTNGSDPNANVLDVEPGDATPAGAEQWVKERLSSNHHAIAVVYTMLSDWQQVKDDVANLPGWMQSKVQYWIADPTGVPHVVAGSSATQWYWGTNYDETTAVPGFLH
jgi:hypothetical protein